MYIYIFILTCAYVYMLYSQERVAELEADKAKLLAINASLRDELDSIGDCASPLMNSTSTEPSQDRKVL